LVKVATHDLLFRLARTKSLFSDVSRQLEHSGVKVSVTAGKLKQPCRIGNFKIRIGFRAQLTPLPSLQTASGPRANAS
jgi:hypothetical protein